MIINFLTNLAWVFAIIFTMFVIGRIAASLLYNEIDKLKDRVEGKEAYFPIIKPGIAAIICWVWIITIHYYKG